MMKKIPYEQSYILFFRLMKDNRQKCKEKAYIEYPSPESELFTAVLTAKQMLDNYIYKINYPDRICDMVYN